MSELQYEIPTPPERRFPIGWILLAPLIALLIFFSVQSYFGRNPYETLLRQSISQQKIAERMGTPISRQEDRLVRVLETLDREPIERHPDLYRLAIKDHLGREITPEDLEKLNRSNRNHRLFAEIFSQESLTPERAKEISEALPSEPYIFEYGRNRALDKGGLAPPRERRQGTPWRMVVAGMALVGAALMGVLLLSGYLIQRARGVWQPEGLPASGRPIEDSDRFAMRTVQIFFLYMFLGAMVSLLVGRHFSSLVLNAIIMVALLAGIFFILGMPVSGKRIGPRELGIRFDRLGEDTLWGIGGALANLPIMGAAAFLSFTLFHSLPPPEHQVSVDLMAQRSAMTVALTIFLAAVLAPVWEEIAFRGALLPAFALLLRSPLAGIALSGIVFASIHSTGIPAWPPLAAVGMMAGFLTYQRKSLIPAIVMHAVHNFLLVVLSLLIYS